MKRRPAIVLLGLAAAVLMGCGGNSQRHDGTISSAVNVVGAMKDAMWKGEIGGKIDLDTIAEKSHLYGLGPVEYFSGELLIIDGRSYRSTVLSDSAMAVEATYKARAPFFVYANVGEWVNRPLPDSVQTLGQLESFLDRTTAHRRRPFAFRLTGTVESAVIHVMNLPAGTDVRTPEAAHQGERLYRLTGEKCEIVGFFSTEHKGIFTHHDSFVHAHLITADRTKMGHLNELHFRPGSLSLSLPAD